MTKEDFYDELANVNISRESRLSYTQIVKNDMSLFPFLIDILLVVDDKASNKAAWVLEFVCKDHIHAIIPYLDTFTKNANTISSDSAIRSVSKIYSFMAIAYNSKMDDTFKKQLQPYHKEYIIETCFDWMINNHKVATKAYAMHTLFLFGKEYTWIHNDLKQILEQDFQIHSAAYKARAKQILHKMKKIPKSQI